MRDFWITFTGTAKPGSVRAASLELAREVAEAAAGEAVRTIDAIPYPGIPILHWDGAPRDPFQPRCTDPGRCRGKFFCQKQPSCSE